MAFLLSDSLKAVLKVANLGNKTSVNVPNDSGAVETELNRLKAIAAYMGVDFEATGYTFRIYEGRNGRGFASPMIALAKDGTIALHWGASVTPVDLKALKAYIDTEDNLSYVAVDVEVGDDETGDTLLDETILFPMSLKVLREEPPAEGQKYPKRIVATKDELRAALKKGNLADLLDVPKTGGGIAKKLDELEPGEYTVIGYRQDAKYGKFEVELVDLGWFKLKGNAAKRVAEKPLLDAEHTAVLTVGEGEDATYNGRAYRSIPTSISLWIDSQPAGTRFKDANGNELEVYSFA